jgi:uncharacterized protein (DUF305 family)
MALFARHSCAGIIFLTAASAFAQQADAPTIIRPGAPGQNSTVLQPGHTGLEPRAPLAADVAFMQGMIMHHAQAIEMTALLKAKGSNKDLQRLGERMTISQSDEIESMKSWLRDRGQSTEMPMPAEHKMNMADMKGMDHSKMGSMDMGGMAMMPGMLTPQQMDALRKASGKTLDHLFLTGMIQHHKGALTMVQELFDTAGAGQDAVLFDFATDVDNTQAAEIKVMQGMLQKEKH